MLYVSQTKRTNAFAEKKSERSQEKKKRWPVKSDEKSTDDEPQRKTKRNSKKVEAGPVSPCWKPTKGNPETQRDHEEIKSWAQVISKSMRRRMRRKESQVFPKDNYVARKMTPHDSARLGKTIAQSNRCG